MVEEVTDTYNDGILNLDMNLEGLFYGVESIVKKITPGILGIVSWILVITFFLGVALSVFVLNPLIVGCRRWYLKNRRRKQNLEDVIHVFSNGYLNVVKVMFCKHLFTFLWSLLFIVPGIVKSYEYRMIPFLLAENPKMDIHKAFDKSRRLMNGNKWEAFVLDFSFIGWNILSSCTCGILGVLYVNPYRELTNTELYVCLCQRTGEHQ